MICITPLLTKNPKQVWTAGQVIGLIHDIPTCADLVSRIEREAVDTLNESSSLYEGDSSRKVGKADGKVGKNDNNPEAQVWGIGQSKL